MWKFLRRALVGLLRIGVAVYLLLAVLLFFFQEKLIYFPRQYAQNIERDLPPGWQALHFMTSQGKQTVFCKLPAQTPVQAPRRVWVFFGGNGSVAWSWIEMLGSFPREDAALLIEYPGYGLCEGNPTPATILDNTETAADLAAKAMGLSREEFNKKLNIVGHSLGCAAGLQFAARHPVGQVVLFAPFTSMLEMARLRVGWPLCELCRHRFNNEARLQELAQRTPPPQVTVFHGSNDGTIPVRMGRKLAAEFPEMIAFHEVPGADHNSVLLDNLVPLLEIIHGIFPKATAPTAMVQKF
ncbi:MAG: alpha/beta fold hydrolase [Chthoniobacteraceae bacterium]